MPFQRCTPRDAITDTVSRLTQGLLAVAVLAGCAQGPGQQASGESLQDRRAAIHKGTAPGITIFSSPGSPWARTNDAAPPPAGTPAPVASVSSQQPQASAPARAATGKAPGLLSALPPPSGRPINDAKKLNRTDQGIPLPTHQPASGAP